MNALCRHRPDCRLCGSRDMEKVLALAPTPPANAFVPASALGVAQPRFPLDVFFCAACGHVQLSDIVDPAHLFENYVYVSGTSPIFVRHFEAYAETMIGLAAPRPGALAVDIGSNDGTLLSFFKKAGLAVLGIDPAKEIARQASAAGIETEAGFFTPAWARATRGKRGPAAIITANNVFAHIDDLGAVASGVAELLADDGLFAFEVSYLADVVEKTLFDTIYHEHLDYHSVKPLIPFLAGHGLELIEAIRVDSHGGSLRGVAQKAGGGRKVGESVARALALEAELKLDRAETFRGFGRRIDALGSELSGLLRRLKSEGRRIAGFGAPAKATTLMHHFGIGPDLVDFIVDDSPMKQGLYTPGLHVPVLPATAIAERRPDYLVILAWNFAQSIVAKNQAFRQAGGRFILPLPQVEII